MCGLVNKSPGRQTHVPGGGVGGHCIPKDPWLLPYNAYKNRTSVRLIPYSRLVNDRMPLYIADIIQQVLEVKGRSIRWMRILIMGYAYLENFDDLRNSQSTVLERRLRELGAELVVHVPYFAKHLGNLLEKAKGCDTAVAMVHYQEYMHLHLGLLHNTLSLPFLVDARHLYGASLAVSYGLTNLGIGWRNP